MEGWVRNIGVVQTIAADEYTVRVPWEKLADSCSSACAACGLCDRDKQRYYTVTARLGSGATMPGIGDRVLLEFKVRDPWFAAVLFFAPPLLGIFIGSFIASRITGATDGLFVAGALVGFVIGGIISLAASRLFPRLARPRGDIIKVVGSSQPEADARQL